MESELYYTPPSQEQFDELKIAAMELWKEVDSYNDKYGYATEKINRIKDLENISENFMFMVAMFDLQNQGKLSSKLSPETCTSIRERLRDGGCSENLILF